MPKQAEVKVTGEPLAFRIRFRVKQDECDRAPSYPAMTTDGPVLRDVFLKAAGEHAWHGDRWTKCDINLTAVYWNRDLPPETIAEIDGAIATLQRIRAGQAGAHPQFMDGTKDLLTKVWTDPTAALVAEAEALEAEFCAGCARVKALLDQEPRLGSDLWNAEQRRDKARSELDAHRDEFTPAGIERREAEIREAEVQVQELQDAKTALSQEIIEIRTRLGNPEGWDQIIRYWND